MAPLSQDKSVVIANGMTDIATTNGGFQTKPVGRRGGSRTKIRDRGYCEAVISLALDGKTAAQIAKLLHTSQDTIRYILDAARIEERRRESIAYLGHRLTEVTKMTVDETLAKRDRRLGHEMLRETGVYEGAKPERKVEDGGRIVIEWGGAPPPWAPRQVIEAAAAPIAKVIEDAKESEAGQQS